MERWAGQAWPSARAHSHLLAALPPGTFPGVDGPDVYEFLQAHAPVDPDPAPPAAGRARGTLPAAG